MRCRPLKSIDVLPDDILLAIFDFCAGKYQYHLDSFEAWQSLVHVCRRWRSVVFGSPRRLNLRLIWTGRKSMKDTLDVWPPLRLVIQSYINNGVGDIVAAFDSEHKDRVDAIVLNHVNSSLLKIAAMQEPFPELTLLRLSSDGETVPVLPDSFLGRSAPRLRHFVLEGIPFPGLPELLLSATHLVTLHLVNIPHSGYISPEAIVTALSTLTSLEALSLEFQSPRSHPNLASRRTPLMTRTVLPVLRQFFFKGVCEYLDDLVARIDAPRLNYLKITFFNDIIFDAPQLIQFISRAPTLKGLDNARVGFEDCVVGVTFTSQTSGHGLLQVEISCRELDWQVSSLCALRLPPHSTSEDFYLYLYQPSFSAPHGQEDNIENTVWLELLRPFTTVKNLHLSKEFAPDIMAALQELVEGRTAEVLPALQNIFLEELLPSGPVQEGIGKFVAARQLSGHSVTVSLWEKTRSRRSMIDKVPSAF
jgi:hypothetical protein